MSILELSRYLQMEKNLITSIFQEASCRVTRGNRERDNGILTSHLFPSACNESITQAF